ncbi:MAG: OmpA family protein [Gammaproteobacteria bacterium]|nr:OmpA family protein [Gammaproteobacteria bacterium]
MSILRIVLTLCVLALASAGNAEEQASEKGREFSVVTNINFDFDSATFRDDSKPKLDRVATLLAEHPEVVVRIVGYTDSLGTDAYNAELSLMRAESVRDYLISRGVAPGRLHPVGRGEANPLVPDATVQGRAVNRRVEFEVVK